MKQKSSRLNNFALAYYVAQPPIVLPIPLQKPKQNTNNAWISYRSVYPESKDFEGYSSWLYSGIGAQVARLLALRGAIGEL